MASLALGQLNGCPCSREITQTSMGAIIVNLEQQRINHM